MRICSLTAFQIPVALRKPVRHASHLRTDNETLIVRCQLDDGAVGWGEGLPRTYVTGESIESVWRHLLATDFSALTQATLHGPDDAAAVLEKLVLAEVPTDPGITPRECFGNAVHCGIELAVLDAITRSAGCSVGDFLAGLPWAANVIQRQPSVRYSGAVTSMSPAKQVMSAIKMRLFGFHQVKVKVGTEGIDDVSCLARIRRIVGQAVDLRLDANEAWNSETVIARVRPLMPFGPTCLEQPIPHADVAELAEVRRDLATPGGQQIPIMLDESLCCREDADRAIRGDWCDYFNLRLSKCGGLIRTLRLAVLAAQHGLGFQLGCQVGETGILSAAGRHFACNVGRIRYLEGSYDRFLVRETLTAENLTFRYGGRAPRLPGPGLGMTVNEARVRLLAVREAELVR